MFSLWMQCGGKPRFMVCEESPFTPGPECVAEFPTEDAARARLKELQDEADAESCYGSRTGATGEMCGGCPRCLDMQLVHAREGGA